MPETLGQDRPKVPPTKKKGGRPPFWTNPEEFSKAVDEFFETESPTWSGLALYLGFESRQSLEDYKKKEGFLTPIKKALLRIESYYEQNISSRNPAGAIFALKNFGWRDKQEVEQTGGITVKFEKPESYVYPTTDEGGNGEPESL